MEHATLLSRLEFVGMDEVQRASLVDVGKALLPIVPDALENLYVILTRTEHTSHFFKDSRHMQAARGLQEEHWRRLWNGRFDKDYYDSVRRIGTVHARIGLEPRWYVGSYAIVLEGLIRALHGRQGGGKWGRRAIASSVNPEELIALVKAAMIDMELAISVYFEEAQVERDKAMAATAAREAELGALLDTISEVTQAVLTGSHEIAQASHDLARRTECAAASIEQSSAEVAQMDARLQHSAASAARTAARADDAINTVTQGRHRADEAMQAMARVADSAKGIDSVIEGLDKVAFQTRVLAMNAAVEAGRAGEAGRGFAVVADLVSALAMRAEEEAKRARDLLTVTQGDITAAVTTVEGLDAALQAIAGDVTTVHGLLAEMAADNQAQATAVTQIASAMNEMDRATQQNAAMVEETSAAADNLMTQISSLAETAATGRVETTVREGNHSKVLH
ncbi:globin-coupled sensor protein [Sphingomonas sp. LaA6.9]|uniref:globin-coupled sensor protein n=1 Tax=Sphingomonas sp. LaA6.9 TaxID=2919914 RepID=UPI002479FD37|nr:globin-coupled sensor protein [Sphingomonas sp. LaA6.9]